MNKTAVFCLTKKGLELGCKIKEKIEIDLYSHKKYKNDKSIPMENGLKEQLNRSFNNYDSIIFIMASGIVVRMIKDLIKTKDIDPAVLVIDEAGNYVYSLLSGHLGGANEFTHKVAKIIDSTPVISTASDVSNKIAVDTLAMKIDGEIDDLKKATTVTSLIVNDEQVNLILPNNLIIDNKESCAGAIIISNRENLEISRIYPKNLIVGIGCKKDKKFNDILNALKDSFKRFNLSLKSIKHFSTVDVKKNEEGIIKLSNYFNKDLIIIDRSEILKIEDRFIGSLFVKKSIGVKAVSAPSAFLSSSQKGEFIAEKLKYDGITISIYEELLGLEE